MATFNLITCLAMFSVMGRTPNKEYLTIGPQKTNAFKGLNKFHEKVPLKASPDFKEIYIYPHTAWHIVKRHWYNAPLKRRASHFNPDMTVQRLHTLATQTINQGLKLPSPRGKNVHQYRFSFPIGKTFKGEKAYCLRVVTDKKARLITAFPVE